MLFIIYTDTTDVREVQAKQMDNDIKVQCNFISCSDAQGCMVVLVGDTVNTTVNVSRCGTCSYATQSLDSHSISCYHEVFAFDIESDGSVGALAIAGEVINKPTSSKNAIVSCAQNFHSGESFMTLIICMRVFMPFVQVHLALFQSFILTYLDYQSLLLQ